MGSHPDDESPGPHPATGGSGRRPGGRVVVVALVVAVVASILALAAVGASAASDEWDWHREAAVGAGVALALVAVLLVVAVRGLRVGSPASRHAVEGLQAAIEIEPEVIRMLQLRTQRVATDELLVAAKVEFLHDLSLVDVVAVVDRIEANIRANIPEAGSVYIEPAVDEPHRGSGTFVADTVGHISRHDPAYARLTGVRGPLDQDLVEEDVLAGDSVEVDPSIEVDDEDIWS